MSTHSSILFVSLLVFLPEHAIGQSNVDGNGQSSVDASLLLDTARYKNVAIPKQFGFLDRFRLAGQWVSPH
jgi:hypothetical protein